MIAAGIATAAAVGSTYLMVVGWAIRPGTIGILWLITALCWVRV